jgi:hypothetical protein
MTRKVLLACGALYGVLYVVFNDAIAAAFYDGYSRMTQAISELSAFGSPTRLFLVITTPVMTGLLLAFGIGVWKSANGRRPLRVAGGILVAFAVSGLVWLAFPMTGRLDMVKGEPMAWNDIGHISMTGLTFVFTMSLFAAGAAAFGKRFKLYTLATALTMLAFGGLTGMLSPRMPDATPWMGFYERVSIGAWLLWMAVLAVMLIREQQPAIRTAGAAHPALIPVPSAPSGPTPPVSQPDLVPSASASPAEGGTARRRPPPSPVLPQR